MPQIQFILLLGSYDPKTKPYLKKIREKIANTYSGSVYAFILENLEMFTTDSYHMLVENISSEGLAIFVFENDQLLEEYHEKVKGNLDETVCRLMKREYNVSQIRRQPIIFKLDTLMLVARLIFLIRDKEETRGGEYLELMYAIGSGHSGKIWFFNKDGIILSEMLSEFLDGFKIHKRSFSNSSDLIKSVKRIIDYDIHPLTFKRR